MATRQVVAYATSKPIRGQRLGHVSTVTRLNGWPFVAGTEALLRRLIYYFRLYLHRSRLSGTHIATPSSSFYILLSSTEIDHNPSVLQYG